MCVCVLCRIVPRSQTVPHFFSFPHQNSVGISFLHVRATCPDNQIAIDLTTRIIYGKEHISCSSLNVVFTIFLLLPTSQAQITSTLPYILSLLRETKRHTYIKQQAVFQFRLFLSLFYQLGICETKILAERWQIFREQYHILISSTMQFGFVSVFAKHLNSPHFQAIWQLTLLFCLALCSKCVSVFSRSKGTVEGVTY